MEASHSALMGVRSSIHYGYDRLIPYGGRWGSPAYAFKRRALIAMQGDGYWAYAYRSRGRIYYGVVETFNQALITAEIGRN